MSEDVNRLTGSLDRGSTSCRLLHNPIVPGLHNRLSALYMSLINALCRQASSWNSLEEYGFRTDTNGSITIPLSSMTNFPPLSESWFWCYETSWTALYSLPLVFWVWFFYWLMYLQLTPFWRWDGHYHCRLSIYYLKLGDVPELDINVFHHQSLSVFLSQTQPQLPWLPIFSASLFILYTKHSVSPMWGRPFEALCMFGRWGGRFLHWG